MRFSLIIAALNEAASLGPSLSELPPGLVQQVIVVDNGSTDNTVEVDRRIMELPITFRPRFAGQR